MGVISKVAYPTDDQNAAKDRFGSWDKLARALSQSELRPQDKSISDKQVSRWAKDAAIPREWIDAYSAVTGAALEQPPLPSIHVPLESPEDLRAALGAILEVAVDVRDRLAALEEELGRGEAGSQGGA